MTWEDYHEGLRSMLWALNGLQADKKGFYYPNHPYKKTVSPALITALKNGIDYYSSSNPAYLHFKDTVLSDYASTATSPDTFEKSIYSELKSFLEKEIENYENKRS